jgi:hypothetical protein
MLGGLYAGHVVTVPGAHDSVDDHGQRYRGCSARAPKAMAGTASMPKVCT